MTSLPYAPLKTDAEVIGFVREHLRNNDHRFRGNSRAAIRRRRRADRTAQSVLEWFKDDSYKASAESYVCSSIGGFLVSILGAIALQWVERLVIRLLTEWLQGLAGASYRAAYARRSA